MKHASTHHLLPIRNSPAARLLRKQEHVSSLILTGHSPKHPVPLHAASHREKNRHGSSAFSVFIHAVGIIHSHHGTTSMADRVSAHCRSTVAPAAPVSRPAKPAARRLTLRQCGWASRVPCLAVERMHPRGPVLLIDVLFGSILPNLKHLLVLKSKIKHHFQRPARI